MNVKITNSLIWLRSLLFFVLISVSVFSAAQNASLRRPISTLSPAWLIHIDVWVNADPKKIIEIIPEDIRPYVIFNISLSVSAAGTGPYGPNVDRYSIIESWLRATAEYGVWVTIQTASGYSQTLPNTHTAGDIYEQYYKTYPNLIGYNFAEQCWGFPTDADYIQRLTLFADLITLGNKYGGYVIVSNAQTMNTPQNNAVAMLKRSRSFRAACKTYTENYISLEKYTTSRGFYDVESTCLGTYLSGYAGNYGIRFDDCGWTYWGARGNKAFPEALGIIPVIEHTLLTGQTVSDGPELTWTMSIGADGTQTSSDGYASKRFKLFPNFSNNNLDVFRKQLDGTFRIPSKEEVIQRTKIAYVNDATSGDNRNKYSSEKSLFTGLYSVDGEYDLNNNWTKSTGRYPTIPTIFAEGEYETGEFQTVVKKSNYATRWPSLQAKVNEFNTLFPSEYSGDIYAARIKNTWITYNKYMQDSVAGTPLVLKNKPASGTIPLKYNTCEKIDIKHSNYSVAVIHEFSNKLEVYLNNFISKAEDEVALLRENVIKIYGSANKQTFSYVKRGDSSAGAIKISDTWIDNVFTLTIKHNGPLDITINCEGNASGRLTDYPAKPVMQAPATPPVYYGVRQIEAEDFEYKNIGGIMYKNAALSNYTALAYLYFGTNAAASIRTKVSVPTTGTYQLKTKYSAPSAVTSKIDLYINGIRKAAPNFTATANNAWDVNVQNIVLNAGDNTIEFRAKASAGVLFFDNVIVDGELLSDVRSPVSDKLEVISETYYTLTGVKVYKPELSKLNGVYIVRSLMSDGSVQSRKIMYK